MRAVCGLARQSMLCKMHEVCPRVCNVFVCVCEVCGLNGARVPTTGARPRRSGAGAPSGTLDFRFRRAPCWRGSVRSKRAVCIRPAAAPRARRGAGGLVVVLSVILKHLKKVFCYFSIVYLNPSRPSRSPKSSCNSVIRVAQPRPTRKRAQPRRAARGQAPGEETRPRRACPGLATSCPDC